MKKILLLVMLVFVGAGCGNTTADTAPQDNTLTIYAYSSLAAEWGLLPAILEDFETQEGIEVEVVEFEDTGLMLNQLITEKENPQADVVIGLDNVNFPTVVDENLFAPYRGERADDIPADLLFDEEFTMTPFDYGYLAFVYDSEKMTFDAPVSLQELATDEKYRGKIIHQQAGLSSPGTQFVLWANAALRDDIDGDTNVRNFWNDLVAQTLTVTPDWSTAYYNFFLEGEAPIVLSYLTSPAYHIDQEKTDRYKTIEMTDGYIQQVEGVAVVNGAGQEGAAKAFVDYVLTDDVQSRIPSTQWVFPVFGDRAQWPAAYDQIQIPAKEDVLVVPESDIRERLDEWTGEWEEAFMP